MTRYIIVGARYNGTTSLEKYLKQRGHDVIRHESLFDSKDGIADYFFRYQDRKPVIIMSDKKNHLFDFKNLMRPWMKYHPKIYYLEELIKIPDFPHENKGSTLQGTYRKEHRQHIAQGHNIEV